MTDFWEILGRSIADKGFRDTLCGDPELKTPNTVVPGGVHASREKYAKVSELIEAEVPDLGHGPVSMFAKGELLRILPSASLQPDLEALAARVETLGVNVKGRSPRFYAALGAMTVDDVFAGQMGANPNGVFGGLAEDEAEDVRTVAADVNGPDSFAMAAVGICGRSWEPDCFVRARPYGAAETVSIPVMKRSGPLAVGTSA